MHEAGTIISQWQYRGGAGTVSTAQALLQVGSRDLIIIGDPLSFKFNSPIYGICMLCITVYSTYCMRRYQGPRLLISNHRLLATNQKPGVPWSSP